VDHSQLQEQYRSVRQKLREETKARMSREIANDLLKMVCVGTLVIAALAAIAYAYSF